MLRRHLSLGSGARLVLARSDWAQLLARLTGHVVIGTGATLVIVPDGLTGDDLVAWQGLAGMSSKPSNGRQIPT